MDLPSPFADADATRRTGGTTVALAGALASLDNVGGLAGLDVAVSLDVGFQLLAAVAAVAVLAGGALIAVGRVDHRRWGMTAGFVAFFAAMWGGGVLAVVALPIALLGGGILLSVPAAATA